MLVDLSVGLSSACLYVLFALYLVAGVEGGEGVGKLPLVTVLGQEAGVVGAATHGPVPAANEGVGHHQGDVVRVHPTASWRQIGTYMLLVNINTKIAIYRYICIYRVKRYIVNK